MSSPSDLSLPPSLVLYQLSTGHYFSRALDLVARLGVADLLAEGPRDGESLAKTLGVLPGPVRRVLRLLVSVGVFAEDEAGRFSLTATGEKLRTDVADSMRSAVRLFAGPRIQDNWKELEFCVRTGEPAIHKHEPGLSSFEFMSRDPESVAIFDEAMAALTRRTALAVAAAYDFSPLDRIVDVGGGNGALLLGILGVHARPKGVVFDLPPAAERARKEIERAGMSARCEAVGGSFFEAVPSGASAYLVKHVLHDWDDAHARQILERCRAAMSADTKLLVIEGVYPDRIDASLASRAAAVNDVNMLVSAGGRARTEVEFRTLFESAGFELVRIVPTPANVGIVEGRPAPRR